MVAKPTTCPQTLPPVFDSTIWIFPASAGLCPEMVCGRGVTSWTTFFFGGNISRYPALKKRRNVRTRVVHSDVECGNPVYCVARTTIIRMSNVPQPNWCTRSLPIKSMLKALKRHVHLGGVVAWRSNLRVPDCRKMWSVCAVVSRRSEALVICPYRKRPCTSCQQEWIRYAGIMAAKRYTALFKGTRDGPSQLATQHLMRCQTPNRGQSPETRHHWFRSPAALRLHSPRNLGSAIVDASVVVSSGDLWKGENF